MSLMHLPFSGSSYVSNVDTRAHSKDLNQVGRSVCCSRGRKKEQYPSIPDCTGRNDKGSMVDTRWPNHDEVQAVSAVKRLRRKRVAVYPLHTFVSNLNRNSTYEGTCTRCADPLPGFYFTTPSSPASTCLDTVTARNARPLGTKDNNYNDPLLQPNCVACTGIPTGHYWVARTPGQCSSDPKPTCQTGYALTSYNDPMVNGTCVQCSAVTNKYFIPNTEASATCKVADCTDSGCAVGEYKASCGGSFAGICTKCTNGNASQIYVSTGGINNICQVDGCKKTCGNGEFIWGCGVPGAVESSLACQKCNNSITNYTY
jgi:hypothetical protein